MLECAGKANAALGNFKEAKLAYLKALELMTKFRNIGSMPT